MSILLFFIGLFLGSFLLVVIDRLPRGESILFGRSHCDMCGHTLAWYDLFPIFSYLLLRGKCRYCHKPYGLQYPFVEITTGLALSLLPIFFSYNSVWEYIFGGLIVCSFVVIFFTDIFYGIIPDIAVIGVFLGTLPFLLVSTIVMHVLTAVCIFFLFFLLYILTRRKGIGFGDVKFAAAMGFLLGFPGIILGLYLAFLTGAVVALILIVSKKKHFHKDTIAFGPFLVLGTIIAWFGGIHLWNFFIHLLFQV